MHFVQTRIATIDTYAVFFILLMYLFMLKYMEISFFKADFTKTLLPLLFSGLAWGFGISSKWNVIYAAPGLAIMFAVAMYHRYAEYKLIKAKLMQNVKAEN